MQAWNVWGFNVGLIIDFRFQALLQSYSGAPWIIVAWLGSQSWTSSVSVVAVVIGDSSQISKNIKLSAVIKVVIHVIDHLTNNIPRTKGFIGKSL